MRIYLYGSVSASVFIMSYLHLEWTYTMWLSYFLGNPCSGESWRLNLRDLRDCKREKTLNHFAYEWKPNRLAKLFKGLRLLREFIYPVHWISIFRMLPMYLEWIYNMRLT